MINATKAEAWRQKLTQSKVQILPVAIASAGSAAAASAWGVSLTQRAKKSVPLL